MTKPRILWDAINDEALRPENLPRAIAAIGPGCFCGPIPRGSITWWRPEYLTIPGRDRVAASFPTRDASVRDSCVDEFRAHLAANVAPFNRRLRDADALLFGLADRRILAVCTYAGEWTTADRANRGATLLDLGAWVWGMPFGKAAARVARAIGLNKFPTAEAA